MLGVKSWHKTSKCQTKHSLFRDSMTKDESGRITDVINMCIYLIKYEASMITEDVLSEVNKELNTHGSRSDVHQ